MKKITIFCAVVFICSIIVSCGDSTGQTEDIIDATNENSTEVENENSNAIKSQPSNETIEYVDSDDNSDLDDDGGLSESDFIANTEWEALSEADNQGTIKLNKKTYTIKMKDTGDNTWSVEGNWEFKDAKIYLHPTKCLYNGKAKDCGFEYTLGEAIGEFQDETRILFEDAPGSDDIDGSMVVKKIMSN